MSSGKWRPFCLDLNVLTWTEDTLASPFLPLIPNPFLWSLLCQPSTVDEQIETADKYHQIRWPTSGISYFKKQHFIYIAILYNFM